MNTDAQDSLAAFLRRALAARLYPPQNILNVACAFRFIQELCHAVSPKEN